MGLHAKYESRLRTPHTINPATIQQHCSCSQRERASILSGRDPTGRDSPRRIGREDRGRLQVCLVHQVHHWALRRLYEDVLLQDLGTSRRTQSTPTCGNIGRYNQRNDGRYHRRNHTTGDLRRRNAVRSDIFTQGPLVPIVNIWRAEGGGSLHPILVPTADSSTGYGLPTFDGIPSETVDIPATSIFDLPGRTWKAKPTWDGTTYATHGLSDNLLQRLPYAKYIGDEDGKRRVVTKLTMPATNVTPDGKTGFQMYGNIHVDANIFRNNRYPDPSVSVSNDVATHLTEVAEVKVKHQPIDVAITGQPILVVGP